jgi:hypothetical protein
VDLLVVIELHTAVLVGDDERLVRRECDDEDGEEEHSSDLDRLCSLVAGQIHADYLHSTV